jgi:ATP-dependent Zn protease
MHSCHAWPQAEALLEVEKQRARELIKLHRDKIEALAHELMRKKVREALGKVREGIRGKA